MRTPPATAAAREARRASAGLALFNAVTPRPWGVSVRQGLPFGPAPRHKADVYLPVAGARPRGLMVFFYGGGWEGGARRDYAFAGRAYAAQGFVTAVPDYRLTGEAAYPAFLEDCALAVAWAQAHAADFCADPSATVLAGHSAGAYNAAMLALDPRWLREAGAGTAIAAWAGLAGPYDFLPLTPGPGQRTFGRVADLEATQPIKNVRPGCPAAFLAHGDCDTLVALHNTARLSAQLAAAGVAVEQRVYADTGHAELVLALAWPLKMRIPVLRDSTAFLHAAAARALETAA